ncbi:MAG: BrnT family toxin [Zoogloeaceae bacterium]|nr:BrnT family toxin [Zoogloeaceae bacterium]
MRHEKRDNRFAYDEIRENAIAPSVGHLYHVTFAERSGILRIISLRHVTNMERKRYVQHF